MWKIALGTARHLTPPSPSAFASFGEGSVIVPPARVTGAEYVHIGAGVVIHEHAWLSVVTALEDVVPRLAIGDGSQFGRMTTIACIGEIEIGPRVLTGERVFIGDTYHGYEDVALPVIEQPASPPRKVTIGHGAFLGVGSIILGGVTIGEGAYVGAGAVVTRDVPARTVVVGNPARVIRRYDEQSREWRWIDERAGTRT
jgi:acetyltransferase-like isoleucine patch superfamily enzyme